MRNTRNTRKPRYIFGGNNRASFELLSTICASYLNGDWGSFRVRGGKRLGWNPDLNDDFLHGEGGIDAEARHVAVLGEEDGEIAVA